MPGFRTFFALPASLELQRQIEVVQSTLKTSQADVRWELPDKFHITLKFLGSVDQTKIEMLSSAMRTIVQQHAAFDIKYDKLGVFPNFHNPRIVWIGSTSHQAMLDLQASVEQSCCDHNFQKEERAFHPHITLGRVSGVRNLTGLTEVIKTITFEPMQSRCTEVLLMKSDLRPNGSIYSILKSFPLQP
jgi:RNA 2',3'-cyclic 3'-phosphodiesterase